MDCYQQEKGIDISPIMLEDIDRHQNIFDVYKSTIVAMAAAINAKDLYPYTRDHIKCTINAYRSTVKTMAATIDAIDSYPQTGTSVSKRTLA